MSRHPPDIGRVRRRRQIFLSVMLSFAMVAMTQFVPPTFAPSLRHCGTNHVCELHGLVGMLQHLSVDQIPHSLCFFSSLAPFRLAFVTPRGLRMHGCSAGSVFLALFFLFLLLIPLCLSSAGGSIFCVQLDGTCIVI